MSIKYMNRVWEIEELKGGRLLVMLALADHANDAGECWPSQPHLAKKARLNERQVRRVIDSLVEDGYVAVIDKGIGRGKRPHYRLFLHPVKADKMSGINSDKMSDKKADISCIKSDISDKKADILSQENRTFPTVKADISDANYSHARSESPIEPSKEPSIESSSLENEDDEPRTPIQAAWFETFQIEMSPAIQKLVDALLVECGEAAVLHGIAASASAKERTFAYIAKCARNYIPPAPEQATRPTYAVDLPGVYQMPATVAPSEPAKPLPPRPLATEALPLDGIWLQMLRELFASLPANSDARSWLRDSRLEETGTAPGNAGRVVPLYTVWVTDPKGLDWCNNRAASTLRRMLGSMVGHSVMVVAAMKAEPAAEVAVSA